MKVLILILILLLLCGGGGYYAGYPLQSLGTVLVILLVLWILGVI